MRTKYLILALFGIISLNFSEAQERKNHYKFDVGGHLGMSNYLGDIGGKEDEGKRKAPWDMKLNQTRWAMGGFVRYKINDYFSVHTSINYMRIQCADNLSLNRGRRGRNLSFRNDIFDFATRAELYIYNVPDVGGTGRYSMDFKSYAFVGVGAFLHNPKANYQGEWIDLRPLKTEGQSVEYSKVGVCIPMGVGFYFTKKRKYRFGWEASWRVTFTDYLDDISTVYADPGNLSSPEAIALANRHGEVAGNPDVPNSAYYTPGQQRGDASENDTYFYMGFTYSYVINRNTFYTQNFGWIGGRQRVKVKIKF